MRIAFLTANFPPEMRGGTELVAASLALQLVQQGHEVTVLTTGERLHDGIDVEIEDFQGIEVRRHPRREGEWETGGLHRPRLLELLHRAFAHLQPDLVHAHHLGGFGAGVLPLCRTLGIATVWSLHDLWVTCPRYFRVPPSGHHCPSGGGRAECAPCVDVDLRKPDIRVVEDAIAARDRLLRTELDAAQVLTAPSRTAAAMVRRHMPTERSIEVVPHGVVRGIEARSLPRGAGEALRIGTFGNLVAAKGVMELVEACAGLPCELHLHGAFLDPVFEVAVRGRAAALGIRLVAHGGYGAGGQHPARNLHLAVFPSRCQETYGLVVDEALAHGVPVVVSDQGALAERAGTGGVVVTTLDSLQATLRSLACDPGRLEQLRAAVPPVLRTMADAARDYLALYGRAAAEVRP